MSEDPSNIFHANMKIQHIDIDHGHGLYLYDLSGNGYIDASGGPITSNLGHGIKEIPEAIYEQTKKISFAHRASVCTQALYEATQKLSGLLGNHLSRVFIAGGGSEANEVAIKIARLFHMANGKGMKSIVIGRWDSYHGNSMMTLAMGGFVNRKKHFANYFNNVTHIPPAYCYRCWYNKTHETCNFECAKSLENEILINGPDNISAFILESFSGASLCAASPKEGYFKRIHEICKKYDILLILDEIMTGFGRTGKWFGYEHFGITPDIVTLGKGLTGGYFPAGAVAFTEELYQRIRDTFGNVPIGHTWSQNPMAAVSISTTIDFIQANRLIEASAEKGERMHSLLQNLYCHPTVGDIRGKGLFAGIEFVSNKETKDFITLPGNNYAEQLREEALAQGMIVLTFHGNIDGNNGDMILLGPYFLISDEEIALIVQKLDSIITIVEQQNGFSAMQDSD